MWQLLFAFFAGASNAQAAQDIFHSVSACDRHPILALGSAAPNFSLPGVDGKTHTLADYAASPILVIVFNHCNHCPIAQMYEQRTQELETEIRTAASRSGHRTKRPQGLRIE